MTHAHRWIVCAPDGREMLPAKCKHCKAVREFPAYGPQDWAHGNAGELKQNRQKWSRLGNLSGGPIDRIVW